MSCNRPLVSGLKRDFERQRTVKLLRNKIKMVECEILRSSCSRCLK